LAAYKKMRNRSLAHCDCFTAYVNIWQQIASLPLDVLAVVCCGSLTNWFERNVNCIVRKQINP